MLLYHPYGEDIITQTCAQHAKQAFIKIRLLEHIQVMAAQVLSLESKVAEYKDQQASFQTQLQQSKLEAQRAQRALRASQHDAAGPSDGAGLRAVPGLALRMQDQGTTGMLDTDSWAEPASVEVKMLPETKKKRRMCTPLGIFQRPGIDRGVP